MKVIGLDLETTGLEQPKGHRIIEVALVSVDFDQGRFGKPEFYTQRINPERAIDPEAEAVHHIGIKELIGCPVWKTVAPEVSKRLKAADLLVAHNMDFDGPFLGGELMRVGLSLPNVETFCTMKNARWASPMGKLPNLGELCWSLRVPYDKAKAHAAEYDVLVTLQCLSRGVRRGFYTLPEIAIKEAA